MSPFPIFASATDIASAVRAGEVSAAEVVEAHLAHIHRHNPGLNAIVTLDEEGARAAAHAADEAQARGEPLGLLHGVPVTIKDAIETAGLRTTGGTLHLAHHIPTEDATAVARLRAAGAIVLGKTNVPVLSAAVEVNNPLFGRTNNPWDPSRTPGGSSGGSAAAVASGMTPLDLGADIGGSLRIPASFCGVCALKPTEHRVPTAGHIPPLPGYPQAVRHMNTLGPLARTVDDLALALRVIAGPDRRQPHLPPVPLGPVPDTALDGLRLAWTPTLGTLPVTADVQRLLRHLIDRLDGSGCRVEQRFPEEIDMQHTVEVWVAMAQAERNWTMRLPEDPATDVPDARQYARTLMQRDALTRRLEDFFDACDALLCPATGIPAFPHMEDPAPFVIEAEEVPYYLPLTPFNMIFNITGHPVVVLPLGLTTSGLPVGVQVVGRRWGEARLLGLARALFSILGPTPRPPGF